MSTHEHAYQKWGDQGPLDYGDPLAEWCPGCGRLRADIEDGSASADLIVAEMFDASDTPRPPMTEPAADLPNHPDDGHPHSWGCRRCGVDQPVQPVLSGLDPEALASAFIRIRGAHNPKADELDGDEEVSPCAWCRLAGEQAAEAIARLAATAPAADEGLSGLAQKIATYWNGLRYEACSDDHESGSLHYHEAATAPAAKTPPDPFDPDQRYLEDRTAPAADEAYTVAIEDAQQVLSDMPGIVDNDGSQPRPEPDYIERAEAVAEVEKLRR